MQEQEAVVLEPLPGLMESTKEQRLLSIERFKVHLFSVLCTYIPLCIFLHRKLQVNHMKELWMCIYSWHSWHGSKRTCTLLKTLASLQMSGFGPWNWASSVVRQRGGGASANSGLFCFVLSAFAFCAPALFCFALVNAKAWRHKKRGRTIHMFKKEGGVFFFKYACKLSSCAF